MFKESVQSGIIAALKAKDDLRLSVLRLLSSAIHNREIEKRTRLGENKNVELNDEEIVQVVRSELKKRRDAAAAYQAGGRAAAAEKEKEEAKILFEFLPAELSDQELEKLVDEGLVALNATSARELGRMMGWVMSRVRGRAEAERVAALVKMKLGAHES